MRILKGDFGVEWSLSHSKKSVLVWKGFYYQKGVLNLEVKLHEEGISTRLSILKRENPKVYLLSINCEHL